MFSHVYFCLDQGLLADHSLFYKVSILIILFLCSWLSVNVYYIVVNHGIILCLITLLVIGFSSYHTSLFTVTTHWLVGLERVCMALQGLNC